MMYKLSLVVACLAAAPAAATFTAGVSIELVVPPRGAVNLPDGGSSDAPHPGRATTAASAASAIQARAMSRAGLTMQV
jgi:hypothetical protein